MKIITKLSLVQLKLTSGTLITYLRCIGVNMRYAQLSVFDTVTLGLVAGAHLLYSYRNEMKERLKN
jgi:formate hydrogenlyase subunit 3/multisubunit Na+/H+ antiporter MnhD subunit